ncbi:hypothetical protein FQN57_005764 [Myotisia sp. PD_48]|nr:hypothetical protein FQN57_005764 [Myotisia sp. PD_48]
MRCLRTPRLGWLSTRLSPRTPPSSLRHFASSPPPPPPTNTSLQSSPLQPFKQPFYKVFLGAVLSYQLIYYAWLRLEVEEIQADNEKTLTQLQDEVRRLAPDEA